MRSPSFATVMKRRTEADGLLFGHPPGGILPHTNLTGCIHMLLSDLKPKFHHLQSNGARALLTAVTVLTCACTQAPSLHSDPSETDSLTIHICSALPYHHIDIFIFADTLTRPLESHMRAGSEPFLNLPAGRGDKLIVALADVRGSFGSALPERYSTMERLTMNYADEDPGAPLQAGQGSG